MNNQPIKLLDAIKSAFKATTKNEVLGYLVKLSVVTLAGFGVVMMLMFITMLFSLPPSAMNAYNTGQSSSYASPDPIDTYGTYNSSGMAAKEIPMEDLEMSPVAIIVSLLLTIVMALAMFVLSTVGVILPSTVLKGELVPIKDLLLRALKLTPKMAILTTITGLCISIGYMLLIVPGILLTLKWMFAPFILVEENVGALEAMKRSSQITKGHRGNLFMKGLGFMGLMFLVTIPLMILAYILGMFGSQAAIYFQLLTFYKVYDSIKDNKDQQQPAPAAPAPVIPESSSAPDLAPTLEVPAPQPQPLPQAAPQPAPTAPAASTAPAENAPAPVQEPAQTPNPAPGSVPPLA
jgi:hypothetical protein